MKNETVETFRTELSNLKKDGCAVLVVGNDETDGHSPLCRQLLGDESFSTRRRLVISTGGAEDAFERLDETGAQMDEEAARLISVPHLTRGAAAATADPKPASGPVSLDVVDTDELTELGLRISETVDDFDAAADGLDPAELRVCFDSVAPFLDRFENETVFRFLHLVLHRVKAVDGMIHVHLRRPRSDTTVQTLAVLFDVVVEVDDDGPTTQQRWHLQDEDLTVGWFDV